jgi:hypothetical protein
MPFNHPFRQEGRGSTHGRFTRALQQRDLWAVETSLRELGHQPSLLDALDYLVLLADVRPDRVGRAAVRWHGLRSGSGSDETGLSLILQFAELEDAEGSRFAIRDEAGFVTCRRADSRSSPRPPSHRIEPRCRARTRARTPRPKPGVH